jgi:hypothetical protein
MDQYEQELYNFLIQENNFNTMVKIMDQYQMVKENLLHDFWNKVSEKIYTLLSTRKGDWQVLNPNNKERSDAKLILYKAHWKGNESHPFVGVAWEKLFGNPYYGVWVNMDSNKINFDLVDTKIQSIRKDYNYRRDHTWWPLWQFGGLNFSNNSELNKILPNRSEYLATEYAEKLIQLAGFVEESINAAVLENK